MDAGVAYPDVAAAWTAAMRRGDFAAAWAQTDRVETIRREQERAGNFVWQAARHLVWNGQPLAGKRVLIRCNHGLGDTLQFVRFVPQLLKSARAVTLLAQPPLVDFLAAASDGRFGEVRNGWTDDPVPPFDAEIEVMELAYACRCTVETLPRQVPYLPTPKLPAPPNLERSRDLRVGLLWAASEWDSRRSIPLAALDALGGLSGVRFFSLQQGAAAGQWRSSRLAIEPLSEHTREITRAAAAMLQLDLILTVDGMAAHLAGGLGVPVWLLLLHDADWRWLDARPDSPWYPTMRLFRQPHPGAWDGAVAAVANALAILVSARKA